MLTPDGQCNRDPALSLSKGGRGLQACFDPRNKSEGRQAQHGVGALARQGELRLLLGVNALTLRYETPDGDAPPCAEI